MNRFQSLRILVAIATLPLLSFAPPATHWQVKSGAKANFQIDGMMGIDVNGTLAFTSSSITFDPANPEAGKMQVALAVSSMETGIGKRDKHLKSDDYFAAGKYPEITFQSTRIERVGNQQYKATGNLKMKAASRAVTIPFTFTKMGNDGLFKGIFNINRVDYGIGNGKETGMGREVRIRLSIPVKSI